MTGNASINWNSANKDYGTVQFGDDSGLVVVFYTQSVRNVQKTLEAGSPIFEDKPYIKIFRAGEMMNQIIRPVEPQDQFRFPRQYQQYTMNKTQTPEGTPIDVLFPNNPSVADTLRGYGIFTIQQLANLTAHGIDTIGMAGQEYVNKANSYLKAATSGKEVLRMQEDMRKKDQQIKLQDKAIEDLRAQVNGLIAKMSDPTAMTAKNINPATGMPETPFIPGYDAQAERINANHVTKDLSNEKAGKTSKFKGSALVNEE